MVLNPDCIRNIMLFCEEHTYIKVENGTQKFHALGVGSMLECNPLDRYTSAELLYHLLQLSESGYIVTDFKFDCHRGRDEFNLSYVYYVTPKGHEFIAKIKNDDRWEGVKSILKPVGAVSLSVIEAVASGVTDAAISRLLSVNQ